MSDSGLPPGDDALYAALETSLGRVVVQLFEREAPNTVVNFVGLATGRRAWRHPRTNEEMRAPLYDGTLIHRVVPEFMVQLGDPFSRDDGDASRVGTGGPGFTFPDEIGGALRFDRPGRVAMATRRRPDSNGSQFFITEVAAPHLNFQHTIFGEVVDGFEKVPKLTRVKADLSGRPLEPVKLARVTITRGTY